MGPATRWTSRSGEENPRVTRSRLRSEAGRLAGSSLEWVTDGLDGIRSRAAEVVNAQRAQVDGERAKELRARVVADQPQVHDAVGCKVRARFHDVDVGGPIRRGIHRPRRLDAGEDRATALERPGARARHERHPDLSLRKLDHLDQLDVDGADP